MCVVFLGDVSVAICFCRPGRRVAPSILRMKACGGLARSAGGGASERRGAQRRGARTSPRAEGAPHFYYSSLQKS